MNTSPATNQPAEDLAKRIGQFVRLRDLKKEMQDKHKEELAPINDAMEGLQQVLQQALSTHNVDSLATASGTAYQSVKESASIEDTNAFWTYVTTQGLFDYLDRKANVTAIKEHIAKHGVPPPGIKFTTMHTVNVRRK